MDLHQWMLNDLAACAPSCSTRWSQLIPTERWDEQADGGGSTLTHLLLHIARHQDLAVTTVIRNHDAALPRPSRRARSRRRARRCRASASARTSSISRLVPPDALLAYVDAMFDATQDWLRAAGLDGARPRARTPSTASRTKAGSIRPNCPGCTACGPDKPWWFVQWPVLGHGHAHVGEGISVRNRMGLSPF